MLKISTFVKKVSPNTEREIIYKIPLLKNFYLNHYATYKFLSCKFKQRFHILERELFVAWLATYNCNFHCKHCEASAGNTNVSELTTDEVFKLVTELSEMKVKSIFIGGGEPLIRKDLFIIIRHILDNRMQYGIASNGYLVDKFEEEFREMKPYMFFTSIDGLEETNDEIRGMRGAFRNSFQALKFFKSIGVDQRVINTVVFPGNIMQLPELKKIILGSSATLWRFALAIPVGRAKDNEKMFLNNEQIKYLFDFIQNSKKEFNVEITEEAGYLGCLSLKLRSQPFFCGAGFTRCSVMPDGEVYGCQIAYDNRFSEGNIRNRSFKEIWEKGFSRFRNPQFDKECLNCVHLNSCRGGCWGMRFGNRNCLREVWDTKK
jgi:radical SAM protein with 4Fe4S-binding SPASM domain